MQATSCERCGGSLSYQSGVVARFEGMSLRLPETLQIPTCDTCGETHPSAEDRSRLHAKVERDLIGFDGSGRPVLRGC